jgi:hypothetical protein
MTRADSSEQFYANLKYMQDKMGMDDSLARDLAAEQIANDRYKFDVSTANGMTQFWENLSYMKTELNMEDSRLRDLSANQIKADWDKFELANESDMTQFWANLKQGKELANMDNMLQRDLATNQLVNQLSIATMQDKTQRDAIQKQFDIADKELGLKSDRDAWEKDIANRVLQKDINEFNLTRMDDMNKFTQTMNWAKESKLIDDTTARYMQSQAIQEQAREFDTKSTNDMIVNMKQLNDTFQMWQIDSNDRRNFTIESMKIQRESMANDAMAQRMDGIIQVLSSPAAELLSDNEAEAMGDLIFTIANSDNAADLQTNLNALVAKNKTDVSIMGKLQPLIDESLKWMKSVGDNLISENNSSAYGGG